MLAPSCCHSYSILVVFVPVVDEVAAVIDGERLAVSNAALQNELACNSQSVFPANSLRKAEANTTAAPAPPPPPPPPPTAKASVTDMFWEGTDFEAKPAGELKSPDYYTKPVQNPAYDLSFYNIGRPSSSEVPA